MSLLMRCIIKINLGCSWRLGDSPPVQISWGQPPYSWGMSLLDNLLLDHVCSILRTFHRSLCSLCTRRLAKGSIFRTARWSTSSVWRKTTRSSSYTRYPSTWAAQLCTFFTTCLRSISLSLFIIITYSSFSLQFFFFSLIWSFPVCEMARGQHRIADLRRQLENRRDNERNQNWGHLLHPSYQRLRGHWERAWNCRGWPCYSPLVTIFFQVIFFYHGSTGMLWRTSQTRTSCWTLKILVPWKIFLRSAVIKLTSRMNGWAKQTKSYVTSKLGLKWLISGLFLLLGEQCSRGTTLLQPVWLPKSQP